MKYVRKLMLVPVEEWEKIRKQQPKITQVASVEVEQSPQMKNMKVMNSGKNVTIKKNMKQTMKQKLRQRMKKRLKERVKEKKNIKKIKWIINALPKKYKSKGFSLLRYVTRNYNMKWEPDGTFKYKNKIIPKSNILHLVLHALLKNITQEPPGMKEFYEGLMDVNVPEYLIANDVGRELIMGDGEDQDWGPIGELASKKNRKKPKWKK